jgi:dCTP deaminase
MILSGLEVKKQIELGRITISPFVEKNVNPVSVDLTLGTEVAVYSDYTTRQTDDPLDFNEPVITDGCNIKPYRSRPPLDSKQEPRIRKYVMGDDGWVLNPGVGYLMHTAERVHTDHYVPILDGKSSIGRLFIQVHVTAGFGDPGFDGQYTLEVTSEFPVRVYPGMRVCQIRFHTIDGMVSNYQKSGTYTGTLATGPVPSRAWRSAFK